MKNWPGASLGAGVWPGLLMACVTAAPSPGFVEEHKERRLLVGVLVLESEGLGIKRRPVGCRISYALRRGVVCRAVAGWTVRIRNPCSLMLTVEPQSNSCQNPCREGQDRPLDTDLLFPFFYGGVGGIVTTPLRLGLSQVHVRPSFVPSRKISLACTAVPMRGKGSDTGKASVEAVACPWLARVFVVVVVVVGCSALSNGRVFPWALCVLRQHKRLLRESKHGEECG